MPNNLVKSLAKKSGKSTSDVEKGWKGGKEEAEKKGLTGDSKYAYANAAAQHAAGKKSKKKEMFDPNQIKGSVETQSRAMNKPADPKVVDSAFEMNKAKADQQGMDKTSPDYWAKVAGDTGKDIGLYSDQKTPLSFDQRGDQGGIHFQRESYVTFEEALNETTPDKFTHTESPKNAGDRDEHLQGYTKVELAKEFAKKLKAKGLSRNEIIHSISNRLLIDVESAKKIVDGEEVEQIDNDGWAPTDPVAPGYRNSISSIYSDVDDFKETKKKSLKR